MSLTIQVVSDLHAEFWSNKKRFNFIKPSANILALLGDTCCVGSDEDFSTFQRFVNELIPSYEHIIIVAGNHEYYFNPSKANAHPNKNNTLDACDKKINEYCKTNPKLHYLNNNSMKIKVKNKTYLLVGSVLWSWIPTDQRENIQSRMNDYRFIYVKDKSAIRHIRADDISNMYLKNKKYIKSQIIRAKKQNMKVVVFTHHKPYLSPTHDPTSYDSAYESDLSDLFGSPIVLWCYGHTHIKDNTKIKGVQFISNPKGYPRQQTRYKRAFTIQL